MKNESTMNTTTVNELFATLITALVLKGRVGTASAYVSTLRKVRRILGENISPAELFSIEGIFSCQKSMYNQGLNNNTISFYMRNLRAIYNKLVVMKMCVDQVDLFEGVYTRINHTSKRAVPPGIFGQLQALKLDGMDNLAFSRDMFVLSFSLQGISFVDLAHLRKCDITENVLTYRRAKTKGSITVGLTDYAREIIKRYELSTEGSPYLFPIIKNPDGNTYLQHRSALRTYNRHLKTLAALAGIEETLTSYTARHTWGTTARHINIKMGVISQGYGHRTEGTTHIYLAEFDDSVLREANEMILKEANVVCLCKTEEKSLPCVEEENVSLFISERQFDCKHNPNANNTQDPASDLTFGVL